MNYYNLFILFLQVFFIIIFSYNIFFENNFIDNRFFVAGCQKNNNSSTVFLMIRHLIAKNADRRGVL